MLNNEKWNVEKHGCNICCFYSTGRKDVVMLEYDFQLGGFRLYSNYAITKQFTVNNRSYNREKFGNIRKYYKVCSTLPYEKGYALFK